MRRKDLGKIIHGHPHVIVGKHYITETLLEEVKRQLEIHIAIKVKFNYLPEEVNVSDAAKYLAEKSMSKVRDVRGKTCILERLDA